jgi:DNA end-binding protein Ku
MRSIWTGAITLSLLNMPVKLGSSTKDNQLGLHMVRKSDGSRIRFTRVAEADGQEVQWNDIAKGYDAPDGSLVILDDEDFKAAYGPKNRVASILMFTNAASVPRTAIKTSYHVQPDKGGEKTYALLAGALQASGKVAILTFAMRQRVALAVLAPQDGYLILESLEWHADVLTPDFAAPPMTASEDEQALAARLIEQMTGDFDYAAQKDVSTEAVAAVIQAKIEKGHVIAAPKPAEPGGAAIVNMMDAIQASLKATRPEEKPKARAPRRRAAAKETA